MNFSRRAQDRLQGAERLETIKSEELFVADLRNLLDETAMRQGVSINFGDSVEAFQQTLDIMDIEELTGDEKYFNMQQGIVRDGGSTSHLGLQTIAPLVEEYGIRGAVDLMQASAWRLEGETFKKIATMHGSVTSWLMLNHVKMAEGDTFNLMPDSTTVFAGLAVDYQPQSYNEYGEYSGVSYQFETAINTKHYNQRLARLGLMLEGSLDLPRRSYILQIGQHALSDDISKLFGFAPTGMHVRFGYYDLKNGRLVRNREASRDDIE